MTREEREKALEVWYDITFDDKRFDEARKISIEALKTEPYKEGLNNAWECARKIGNNSQTGLEMIGFDFSEMKDGICLHYNPSWWVVEHYTASEAMQKIKEYEEKQKIEGTEE